MAKTHQKEKKKSYNNAARIIIIIIAAAVISFCLYNIISYYVNADAEESEYYSLKNSYSDSSSGTFSDSDEEAISSSFKIGYFNDEKYLYDPTFTDYKDIYANVDVKELRKQYPDISAWIYIPGTKISYPVLSSKKDHYLYRNYKGERVKSGSIFYYNKLSFDPQNDNICIFGHNMKSGMMFGSLKSFWLEDDMWPDDKDTYIYLILEDRIQKYQIFAIYIDNVKKNKIPANFSSALEKIEYFESVMRKSYKTKEMSFDDDDVFITLSTCTHINNAEDDDRLLIAAKLID